MRRSAALYGILGLVLLSFGLVDYFISSGFRLFVWVNLAGGIFAIVLWITSSRSELSSITDRALGALRRQRRRLFDRLHRAAGRD